MSTARTARLARARSALRESCASSRPLSFDYQSVGVAGEEWLRRWAGAEELGDWKQRRGGDGGCDLCARIETPTGRRWFSIDVKTARRPGNLIVEEGKVMADIYVLLRYDDATGQCSPVGWEWGKVMLRMPKKDFGYGVINHYRHNSLLRRMHELQERMTGEWQVFD